MAEKKEEEKKKKNRYVVYDLDLMIYYLNFLIDLYES